MPAMSVKSFASIAAHGENSSTLDRRPVPEVSAIPGYRERIGAVVRPAALEPARSLRRPSAIRPHSDMQDLLNHPLHNGHDA